MSDPGGRAVEPGPGPPNAGRQDDISAVRRVLVIDDDPPILRFAAAALRLGGFAVDAAATGAAGLQQARATPPNAILLDLMLPGLSGLDVLRAIRADERLAAVPVLILTAGNGSAESLARDIGATSYLRKPIGAAELIAAVRRALGLGET